MKHFIALSLLAISCICVRTSAQTDCDRMAHFHQLDGRPEQACLSSVEVCSTPAVTISKVRNSRTRAMEDLVMRPICRYPIQCTEPLDYLDRQLTSKRAVTGAVSGSLSLSYKTQLGASLLEALSLGAELGGGTTISSEWTVSYETTSSMTLRVYQMDCHIKKKRFFRNTDTVTGSIRLFSVATWTLGYPFTDSEGVFHNCAQGTTVTTMCLGGSISGKVSDITELDIADEQTACCSPLNPTSPALPCCGRICQ